MYKLLIVDNKGNISNELFEVFCNMKHLDLDIYKAYSGEEAMEWLRRTKIDIVITDIRMPKMDGIQLLNAIYKNWPQCRSYCRIVTNLNISITQYNITVLDMNECKNDLDIFESYFKHTK